ncbi:MAG: hypothetical protein ACYS0G_02215 [Planctomycetota bacterium]|jgi:hypothetical protein
MGGRLLKGGAPLVGLLCTCAAAAADEPAPPAAPIETPAFEAEPLEPEAFLTRLVERYRRLSVYQDTVDVVHTTIRADERPHRVATRFTCRVENETLRVETPGTHVRDGIGLEVPLRQSPAMEALVLQYNLWLAPHMVLRFADEPLEEFRLGVEEGFALTGAEPVDVGARRMVRLKLRSRDPQSGEAEDATARFDLYVGPQSMLIERIEGEQRLPDGASYRTTLDIMPLVAEDREDGDGVTQSRSDEVTK